jgi:hypothetical protein
MYPSPIKSKGLSPLRGLRESPFRKSPPETTSSACQSTTDNDNGAILHPVLDGSNRTERQLSAIEDVQHVQSKASDVQLRREWNPSEAEFVDVGKIRDAAQYKSEALPDETTSTNIGTSSSSDPNHTFQKKAQSTNDEPTNQKDGDATDDDEESSSEDETGTIPTLDTYKPREPSYTKANAVPFHTLCKRLDLLWNKRRSTGKKAVSKQERLKYLLPDSLFNYLEGGSPYPFLRLICPDHDSSRPHTGLKEATIAKVWADAMGLLSNSRNYKRLTHYRDPEYNGTHAGDLSVVIHQLMEERYGGGAAKGKGSNLTVEAVNDWLDVLVDIVKDRYEMAVSNREGSSAWKISLETAIGGSGQQGKKMKKHDRYVKLLEKLISKNLSVSESCIVFSLDGSRF